MTIIKHTKEDHLKDKYINILKYTYIKCCENVMNKLCERVPIQIK